MKNKIITILTVLILGLLSSCCGIRHDEYVIITEVKVSEHNNGYLYNHNTSYDELYFSSHTKYSVGDTLKLTLIK